MVHAHIKKYVIQCAFILCTTSNAQHPEKQTLCFLSFLDAGETILQDSFILTEADANDPLWTQQHDLLLGHLTRLEYELRQLYEQRDQTNTSGDFRMVLVSDFEFLATFLQKSEDVLKQCPKVSPLLLQTLAVIKQHISSLLYDLN